MSAIACLLLWSCNNAEEKAKATEAEALAYTIYTEKTELFVEFRPLVAGETSKFAAHFTKLGEFFTPITKGKVTVRLIQAGREIHQTADSPSNPGIFRLALKPQQAGIGRLEFDIITDTYTDKVIIDSVVIYPDKKAALAAQSDEAPNANEISYLKEQAWKIEFANEPVTYRPFNDVIHTSGQILPAPGDEATIVAKSDGTVRFNNPSIVPGKKVSAGESLFTISGAGITNNNIDAAVQTARSEYNKAKADYDRARELVKDQLITQREFQEIQLRYNNSSTQLNNLSKGYSAGGKSLSSPIAGFIRNVLVTSGQFVTAGQPLAAISQNKKLMLRADISQKDFGKTGSIQSANFITPDKRVFTTAALNGKLLSAGRATTGNSMMIPVFFEIDNRENLVPGSVVEVYLNSGIITTALAIPVSALIEEQGKFYAYVQTAGESFEKRELQLGAGNGIEVQVLSGISEGERVVTKGAYQVKLATMSGTMPAHGHEH
jgi:membrane fusion protein, heavy metal efflux system